MWRRPDNRLMITFNPSTRYKCYPRRNVQSGNNILTLARWHNCEVNKMDDMVNTTRYSGLIIIIIIIIVVVNIISKMLFDRICLFNFCSHHLFLEWPAFFTTSFLYSYANLGIDHVSKLKYLLSNVFYTSLSRLIVPQFVIFPWIPFFLVKLAAWYRDPVTSFSQVQFLLYGELLDAAPDDGTSTSEQPWFCWILNHVISLRKALIENQIPPLYPNTRTPVSMKCRTI